MDDFDLQLVLRCYSAQELALKTSHEQKFEGELNYEQLLQQNSALNEEYIGTEFESQIKRLKCLEKMNIRNALINESDVYRKTKWHNNKYEIIAEKESEDFVSTIEGFLEKIKKFNSEFDENKILRSKDMCIQQIHGISQDDTTKIEYYNKIMHLDMGFDYLNDIETLKRTYNNRNNKTLFKKMAIEEKIQQSLLVRRNIEFLQQSNGKLKDCS